jgi:hypothetical protein
VAIRVNGNARNDGAKLELRQVVSYHDSAVNVHVRENQKQLVSLRVQSVVRYPPSKVSVGSNLSLGQRKIERGSTRSGVSIECHLNGKAGLRSKVCEHLVVNGAVAVGVNCSITPSSPNFG